MSEPTETHKPSSQTEDASSQAPAAGEPQPAPAVEPEIGRLREEMHGLRADLEEREKRLDEIARAYSALLNDQMEFRARLEREKERVLESERGKIALHILQVADELERALAAARGDESPLAQGVRLIHEGLARTLAALGLERLSLVGTPFDPNVAEALDVVPTSESKEDARVLTQLAPGYKLGSRVLRPARVRVARYLPVQAADHPQAEAEEGGEGAHPEAPPT